MLNITERYRACVRLRLQGATFREVATILGGSYANWCKIEKNDKNYQAYMQYCQEQLERDYQTSTKRLVDDVVERGLSELMLKRRQRLRQSDT